MRSSSLGIKSTDWRNGRKQVIKPLSSSRSNIGSRETKENGLERGIQLTEAIPSSPLDPQDQTIVSGRSAAPTPSPSENPSPLFTLHHPHTSRLRSQLRQPSHHIFRKVRLVIVRDMTHVQPPLHFLSMAASCGSFTSLCPGGTYLK